MTVKSNLFERYSTWLNPNSGLMVHIVCIAELEENHQRLVVFQKLPNFGKCYVMDYMVFCKTHSPVGALGARY